MILRLTRELGVNIAGVDVALRLKEQMELMETEIAELRHALAIAQNKGSVAPDKALVTTRSQYDIIIFTDK